MIKLCKGCNTEKALEAFVVDKSKSQGRSSRCKVCIKAYKKTHYLKNKESINEKCRIYRLENKGALTAYFKVRYQENKEEILEYQKRYFAENKPRISDRSKEYNRTHKAEIKESKRKHALENSERLREKRRAYYEANSKELKAASKIYKRERARTDINFKLACGLRTRIGDALKRGQKAGSAVRDLGCSVAELKMHLETLFQPGMSWENHGQWHIDHIIPLASFDLTDREQFLKACHYTNLQPLWASDNHRKKDKLDWEPSREVS